MSHTANCVMDFWKEKFENLIISKGSSTLCPAKRPNLNPLNCWFLGFSQAEVHKQRPQTLEKVHKIVQKVFRTSKTEAMNIAKNWLKKCIANNGSHFGNSL